MLWCGGRSRARPNLSSFALLLAHFGLTSRTTFASFVLMKACPSCPKTSTYVAHSGRGRCLVLLTVRCLFHLCSCPQLKPFGAKEEDDEVDYGQDLSDADAPKNSKTQPLQVTISPVPAVAPELTGTLRTCL